MFAGGSDRLAAALLALDSGDPAPAWQMWAAGEGDEASEMARLALGAAAGFAGLPWGIEGSPDSLRLAIGRSPPTRQAAAMAAVVLARAARIGWDTAGLLQVAAVHEALLAGETAPGPRAWLDLTRGWQALLAGEWTGARLAGERLRSEAARLAEPALVIEATVLRALVALGEDKLDDALDLARRAARMAQTEELRPAEYLAHLALARVRRRAGHPYLAARILASLAAVAPAAWTWWLTWERAFAPGPTEAEHAEVSLVAAARAAERGDREGFSAAGAAVLARTAQAADLHREAETALQALDPEVSVDALCDPVRAWCIGEVDHSPLGISEVGHSDAIAGGAWVVAEPRRRPRRALGAGLGLLSRETPRRGGGGAPRRVELAAAALAVAGEAGRSAPDWFQAVYGFPYVENLHRGNLDTLLYRVRLLLEGVATLDRVGADVSLTTLRPFVVADPRCSRPLEHRLMLAVAAAGECSARDLATTTGMPLRTVQAALHGLVSEGAVRAEGLGPRRRYLVEDTTFREPTRGG